MRWTMLGALAVAAMGCAEPEVLEPLSVDDQAISGFLFQHFDDADPTEMTRGIDEILVPLMLARLENVKDRNDPLDGGWLADLPVITEKELGTLSMPAGVTVAEQKFPTARVRESAFSVADNRALAVEPNRVCLESETTLWAEREFTSDAACFADGTCDRITILQPTYKQNPIARIWYDQLFDIRVFTIDDGKGNTYEAMVSRGWLEERWFSRSGNNSWDQIWSLDVIIDDGNGGSLGWNAYWTSLQIDLLGDDLLLNSIRDGLHQAAYWSEGFLETGEAHPDCPNDRAADAPERWKNVEG